MPFAPLARAQDASSWEQIRDIDWCKANSLLPALHWCSYQCFLSRFAPGAEPAGRKCWLGAQPSGAPGSRCSPVPVDDIGSLFGY